MLGPGRYLLGAVELIWLVGFAWIGAGQVRRRLLGELTGEAAFLTSSVVAIALLVWVAEILGTVSLFKPAPYLAGVALLGLALRLVVPTRTTASPSVGGAPVGAPRRAEAAPPPSTVGETGGTGPAAQRSVPSRPSLIATALALLIAGPASPPRWTSKCRCGPVLKP